MMDFALILFTAALSLTVVIALYIYATRTTSHSDQVSQLIAIGCFLIVAITRFARNLKSSYVTILNYLANYHQDLAIMNECKTRDHACAKSNYYT